MRYKAGEKGRMPHRALVHMIAARYSQHPDDVEDWPADTFLEAVRVWEVTG